MVTPPRIVSCSSVLAAIYGAITGGVCRELEEDYAKRRICCKRRCLQFTPVDTLIPPLNF